MLRSVDLLTAIALSAFFIVVGATAPVCAAGDRAAKDAATDGSWISPNEVTLQNLEEFQAQMRDDLPVGTPKEEVEDYLVQRRLRYLFIQPAPIHGDYGNSFQCLIENIGTRGGLQASLSFWIRLDEADAVEDILFRVKYL